MTDEVLPNLLGITDAATLRAYELEVSALRVKEIADAPQRFAGDFDFPHLQRLHGHILGDVYAWAGEIRDEETGAMGMAHCRVEFLHDQIRHTFGQIAAALPLPSDPDKAAAAVAEMWGETTALHPFRDGNSRSQTVLFDMMLTAHGHAPDWTRIDAAAVHAARHVAMRTLDSSYLAAELRPGLTADAASSSLSITRRDNTRVIELYADMIRHRAAGAGTATQYRAERIEHQAHPVTGTGRWPNGSPAAQLAGGAFPHTAPTTPTPTQPGQQQAQQPAQDRGRGVDGGPSRDR